MSDHVCILLLLLRVNEQSSACHSCHVTVLAADVDVDSSVVEHVVVAVSHELVHGHVATRLNHDG